MFAPTSMLHRLLLAFLFLSLPARALELGIDRLAAMDFAPLAGKRVGLITNQTGVTSNGTRTRLILKRAPNVQLVALFSPEHGLDGTAGAGRYVATRRDSATGLTVFSLYGPTRKPSPTMLRGLDALVFDMQDIGCRSYTYVSTMVKCMEAAGEAGIEFIVLDRPNPLGGNRVEGPMIESRWISFVGPLPVPYVHGMTVGELAKMANARGWTGHKCKLTVIPMSGWSRGTTWSGTGLRWVPTSPNIPRANSCAYYVATGLVGELKAVETGTGGPTPFEFLSSPGLNGPALAARLRTAFPDLKVSAIDGGVRFQLNAGSNTDLSALGVHLIAESNRAARPSLFARYRDPDAIFYKCYGSTSIRTQCEKGVSAASIVSSWSGAVSSFRSARKPYLLY